MGFYIVVNICFYDLNRFIRNTSAYGGNGRNFLIPGAKFTASRSWAAAKAFVIKTESHAEGWKSAEC